MPKVLSVTRIDLSTYDPASPVVVIPLECWRYTLSIYQPAPRVSTINGQALPNVLNQPGASALSATWVERVGGYPEKENNVRETLEIVLDPVDRFISGIITIESWQDA